MTEFKTVTNIYTGELTDSTIVNAKEIEIIKKMVTKDDVVLDVGANVGFMTIQLAQLAKRVYAFEPDPDNFKQLEQVTKRLHSYVTLYNVAVSDHYDDHGILYQCPQDPGMHRMYPSKWCEGGKQIHDVVTITLDSIMPFTLTEKIDFIKLDVEGYEYYALQGMIKLLNKDHPTLLMEFHPLSIIESGANPEDIYNLLKHEFGYDDPFNCSTDYRILSYEDLDRQTRDQPAVNILWKYNNSN
jgi:FkbM family methyltransferase